MPCRGREGKGDSKERGGESFEVHSVTSEKSLDEDRDGED